MGLQVPQEHTEGALPPAQPPEARALQAALLQPWGEGPARKRWLGEQVPRLKVLNASAQARIILILKGRTRKFRSRTQVSDSKRYLQDNMCSPDLTWASLKGRHPAAARRKRALWRGKLESNFSFQPQRTQSVEAETHRLELNGGNKQPDQTQAAPAPAYAASI